MGRAKDIIVKVIPAKIANEFVKKHHYSGKVVNLSNLHFGCFLDDKLHGVMSYGPPMDKRNVLKLVDSGKNNDNEKWNEMLDEEGFEPAADCREQIHLPTLQCRCARGAQRQQ